MASILNEYLAIFVSLGALVFAFALSGKINSQSEGNETQREIALKIRTGASPDKRNGPTIARIAPRCTPTRWISSCLCDNESKSCANRCIRKHSNAGEEFMKLLVFLPRGIFPATGQRPGKSFT